LSQVVTYGAGTHVEQFYESDAQLADALCALISGCFAKGACAAVIATAPRGRDIEESLVARGVDIEAARARRQYFVFDAACVLSRILVRARPERARVQAFMHELASAAAPECRGIWMYGEMVTLLWAQGMYEAALQLEDMWAELAHERGFALHRAYPLRGFSGRLAESQLERVCARDSSFIPPPENSALAGSLNRLRVIDQLRRKAILRRERESMAPDLVGGVNGRCRLALDGRILWANSTELDLLGYAAHEYIGRHISEFHAEPAAVDDILLRLRSSKELYDYPARRLCKNGSVRSALMYSTGLWKWERSTYVCCLTRFESEAPAS
jgi:PAS domain S-box-containing protein